MGMLVVCWHGNDYIHHGHHGDWEEASRDEGVFLWLVYERWGSTCLCTLPGCSPIIRMCTGLLVPIHQQMGSLPSARLVDALHLGLVHAQLVALA